MIAYYKIYHVYKIVILCISVDWCFVDMLFAGNVYIDTNLFPFDHWICIYSKRKLDLMPIAHTSDIIGPSLVG